jgi:hypothetical protein
MQYGQGAKMALPIFGYYMQKVYADGSLDYNYMFDKVTVPAADSSDATIIPPVDVEKPDDIGY